MMYYNIQRACLEWYVHFIYTDVSKKAAQIVLDAA